MPADLPDSLFPYILAFFRIGSFIATAPAIGEAYIPAQIRLALALPFTFIVAPLLSLPPEPAQVPAYVALAVHEVIIGLGLGLLARLMVSSLSAAGAMIANQTALAAAQYFDPSIGSQSVATSSLLSLAGIAIIFASGLHHAALIAIVDSYRLFPAGDGPPFGGLADSASLVMGQSFALALALSAPFIIFSMIFNLALGAVNRMSPQFQVFFVAQPLQTGIGFLLLAGGIHAIMEHFADAYLAFFAMIYGH